MPIVKIDSADPGPALEAAGAILRGGGVVLYPTDTLYGLGARVDSGPALDRIFAIKRRDTGKPLPVIVRGMDEVRMLAGEIPPQALRLMTEYWPGPLTIVLTASGEILPRLLGNKGKIGLRWPDHPFLARLLLAAGGPLTATSANLSGQPPVSDAEEGFRLFNGKVDLLLDGGRLVSEPSTVVDASGEKIVLLRAGKLKIAAEAG